MATSYIKINLIAYLCCEVYFYVTGILLCSVYFLYFAFCSSTIFMIEEISSFMISLNRPSYS